MKNSSLKAKLSLMNFLEFAVWGAYLISMGMFLSSNGLGPKVFWFYTVQGLVSIFMPALIGIVADRWIPAQKTLSLCHLLAGVFMIAAGVVAANDLATTGQLQFGLLFTLYSLSVAFFMPTIGLCNSVAFNALEKHGLSTVKDFPPIRVFGTVGFIVAEVIVNFASLGDGVTIQHSYTQFYLSGALSIVLSLYALTMPNCPVNKGSGKSLSEALGLKAFALFKDKQMAIFFIFSMLLGVSLQITNTYGSSFINHFNNIDAFKGGFWAANPTFLISISQCAEALCILLIPFCLRKFGIKGVMLMAMLAWVLRFGFFGLGNTNFPGVTLLILSCIVYGVAFDFFNVSGGIYVDSKTEPAQRSSAQGLFMLMTNGIGASLGTFIAGNFIVNKLVPDTSAYQNADGTPIPWPAEVQEQVSAGWTESWLIFAGYALVVGVLFFFLFKTPKHQQPSGAEIKRQEGNTADGIEGFADDKA